MPISRISCAIALSTVCQLAAAHVVLDVPKADAGSSYKATLRITHGCEGSPTRVVVVEIPPGVEGAKPMAKPGWSIAIEREKLATPRQALHGRTVTEEVRRIRWTGGPLPGDHFDEFVLMAKLPDKPGVVWWKVSQECEKGRLDWNEIPAAGQKPSELKSPAARLDTVAPTHAGHSH